MIGMLKKVRSLLKLFSRNCFIYFLRGLTQRSTSQVTACFDSSKKKRKRKKKENINIFRMRLTLQITVLFYFVVKGENVSIIVHL